MELLETVWAYLFDNFSPYWILTLGTFVLHFVFYFGLSAVYFILETMPSMQKYKIQKIEKNTKEMKWHCFIEILKGDIFPQLLMMTFVYPVISWMGARLDLPFPDWKHTMLLVFVFFVIEDAWFYWVHRLLHWGPFYTYIHKVHHTHTSPFPMAAEYAHPVETIILGFGSFIGPLFFKPHMLEIWVWLFFRLWQEIDAHCGYDYPWSLHHFLPIWGGSEFHDFHHMNFVGNYGSTLRVWDKICGTDNKFHAWKAKQAKVHSK
eukprot:TRINITY_DN1285_c0_g1_i1.p1 TRINITY_DN1285_c0_g1~~TRINITY_DN1285_c0_g1_i1.p1  ORF type:complete len:262 (-),score=54.97 TRINITY_DN1285_c0_g1_i1:221-1006(-)